MKTILIFWAFLFFSVQLHSQDLTQTVKGRVVDHETQISLPGATVTILGTDPLIGTITDLDGYFRIENVPVGRYNIEVSYLGYQPFQVTELMVSSGKEVSLNVELNESVKEIDEAVVKAYTRKDRALNSMATLSARSFSVEEAGRYAGGFDDPARMASSFAGITTGALGDNSIVIRGNAPKGILWKLEGVPIPNPNHFAGAVSAGGGFVTIFSSQLMANSDFFTGAFPAEYGNALAGVFDMKLRTGNQDKREYWFQAGLLGVDFGSEGPIVMGKKATYLFNYRYSTYGLIKPLFPEGAGLPTYQDLSFKFNFPTKKAGIFSLWGIGAIDEINKYEEEDSASWEMIAEGEREKTNMKPAAAGLTHKYILGNKTYLNTTIAATNYSGGHDRRRLDSQLNLHQIQHIDVNEQKIVGHSFLNHKFSARHTNRTGIIYNHMFYNIDLRESETAGAPMQQFVDDDGNSGLWQFYSQSKFVLGSNITANSGVHASYFDLNNNYSIEPRFGIRWDFIPNHAISFAAGKHSQLEDLKIYLAEQNGQQPNKNLDYSSAWHFVLGYDWKLSDYLRLKVEPYYQQLSDVPVIKDSTYSMVNFHQQWFFNDALVNEGTGTNIGVDFTVERFLNNGYYWLSTASVFDSKYVGGDGIERNSAYDRGYVANLLFGKEFYFNNKPNKQRILSLNGKLTFLGGERLNPVLENESIQKKEIVFDHTNAFSMQSDPSLIANITINYRKNKPNYSSVWSLQIINLFGAPSTHYDYYNYKTNDLDVYEENFIVPNLSYKIEF